MDARMRTDQRSDAVRRRRKPGEGRIVHIPFDGNVPPAPADAEPPAEIIIDATDAAGVSADWLTDYFWLDILQQWSSQPVVIRFQPTHESLLNPVVLHQVNMLRRVAPEWRIVGECYLSDLAVEGRIAQAAVTGYHEIRVLDANRPGAPNSGHPLRLEDAAKRFRQVQTASQKTTPIFVRCPVRTAAAPQPAATTPAAERAGSLTPVQ